MEALRPAFEETVGNGKFYTYDHFGSMDSDNLLSKIRYLIKGFDCKWIFLDHLSIVISGIAGDDERRLIDNTMTKLRSLVEETGCGMILVSHLKRVDSGHEEGGRVSLHHLRGSQAIAQLSDMVIGLERNQQADQTSNETRVRVLKNRFSGETGHCLTLHYDHDTGRYTEDSNVFEDKTIKPILKTMKTLFFDIETNAIEDWSNLSDLHTVHCLSIYDPTTPKMITYHGAGIQNGLQELAKADRIVGHNVIGFDLPALSKMYGFHPPLIRVLDTMVMAKCIVADVRNDVLLNGKIRIKVLL